MSVYPKEQPRCSSDHCFVIGIQEVKAAALGPRHSTAALSSVAADPWLSIVREDAGKGAEAGWFWQYKLNSIKVHHLPELCLLDRSGASVPLYVLPNGQAA